MKDKKIRLYTSQTPEVIELIKSQGFALPDKSKEYDAWPHAYDWMRGKMVDKGLLKSMSQSMFWAYNRLEDLQDYKDPIVVLEKPISEVLASDHMDWHCILNNAPIVKFPTQDTHEKEVLLFDEIYDALMADPTGLSKVKTWDICLDVNITDEGVFPGENLSLGESPDLEYVWQFTFADIKAEDIVEFLPAFQSQDSQ